ncbi:MAG: hypothetical protein ACYS5V_11345, partial [Planctomycetota bacterium]
RDHRQDLTVRRREVSREIARFRAGRGLCLKLAGCQLKAMVFFDIAPADRPWTVMVPAPRSGERYEFNQAMAEWVGRWASEPARRRDCPSLAPAPADLLGRSDRMWRVSAQAAPVVQVGGAGTCWPGACLPGEVAPDLAALAVRLAEAAAFLEALERCDQVHRVKPPPKVPKFYFNIPEWDDSSWRHQGTFVRRYGGGSVEATEPVGGVVVLCSPRTDPGAEKTPPDRWMGTVSVSNRAGTVGLMTDRSVSVLLTGAQIDRDGRIRGITQLHPGKRMAQAGDWNRVGFWKLTNDSTLCLFQAQAIPLVGVRNMTEFKWQDVAKGMAVLRAGNVEFPRLNLSADRGLAAAYVNKLRRFKVLNAAPLLLNNWPGNGPGDGYVQPERPVDVLDRSARDLWTLNETRLAKLRRHGIIRNDVEGLHQRAEAHRDRADALGADAPGAAQAHRAASLQYSGLVYEPIQATTNDLIQAVVILLLLAIPFAYAVERVAVGTPNIYRQIGGFGVIFLAVFLTLYTVHPAFQFATFPMLVLLAFVIIMLSGLVIWIVKTKFEHEVKKLQGIATASHRSTRNARQTLAAAVIQGIASMRRRPLRTVLTATTIVLLTFTIMFFASVSTERGVHKVLLAPVAGPRQVEIQLSGGRTLDPQSVHVLRSLWADRAGSFARRWNVAAELQDGGAMPAWLPGGKVTPVAAWAQIAPEDLKLYPELARTLAGDVAGFVRDGGILLPRGMAPAPAPGGGAQLVEFEGRRWVVRGTFDPVKLRMVKTVSGASFVPPDIAEMRRLLEMRYPPGSSESAEAIKKALRQLEPSAFPLVDAESMVLLSEPRPGRSQTARGIVLLPASDAAAETVAAEAAALLGEPVVLSA